MPSSSSPQPWLRKAVALWFLIDAIIALAPPLYWAAGGWTDSVLGVPGALFYFLAVNVVITASLVFAYLVEREEEEA
jgi:hypothetical protein